VRETARGTAQEAVGENGCPHFDRGPSQNRLILTILDPLKHRPTKRRCGHVHDLCGALPPVALRGRLRHPAISVSIKTTIITFSTAEQLY
jgi:hypothetical protein